MNHLIDHLGWIPFQTPREAHHAAFAAYLHARTGCRLILFWRCKVGDRKDAGEWWWWEFRTARGTVIESAEGNNLTPDELHKWADGVLAKLSLTDPTLGVPTEEG